MLPPLNVLIFLGFEMKKIYFYLQIIVFAFVSNSNICAAYRDFTSTYNVASEEKIEKFAEILGINPTNFKYDLVAIVQKFINQGVKGNKIDDNVIEKFNGAFVFASGEGWLDVLETFFASPIFMLTLDPKSAREALISAANNDHTDFVARLLMNNVFMDSMGRPLYSSDTKKENDFLSEFNIAVKSVLKKWTIDVFCTFFSSDSLLNIIDKSVVCLIIDRSIILGRQDLLGFVLNNGRIRELFSKDEILNYLPELEKMRGQGGYPYDQMQSILSLKRPNSRRNDRCTLF